MCRFAARPDRGDEPVAHGDIGSDELAGEDVDDGPAREQKICGSIAARGREQSLSC